jgi:hypothetical protein
MFLTEDIAAQVGTFALVPQIVDSVAVPVIAGRRHRLPQSPVYQRAPNTGATLTGAQWR